MATRQPKRANNGSAISASSRVKDNKALKAAVATAATLLQRPEVREQLVGVGQNLAERLRARSSTGTVHRASPSRSTPGGDGTPGGGIPLPALTPHQRLERRTEKLASIVELLRANTTTQRVAALDQIDAVIEQVRLSLAVAKNLPARRRLASHREIGSALTSIEKELAKATSPTDLGAG